MIYLKALLLFPTAFLLFTFHSAKTVYVKKASKTAIGQINELLNEKIQREFLAQNDDQIGKAFPFADALVSSADTIPVGILSDENRKSKPHFDELRVNKVDEYFHGDIELTEWQALRLRKQILESLKEEAENDEDSSYKNEFPKHRRKKRKIGRKFQIFNYISFLEPIYKRWDKTRPINYDFADSIPEPTRQIVRSALATWQRHTCLRFREGGPDVDRIEFFDGGGCSSFVGRTAGTQGISISTPGCDHIGIVAHEVGHALGIFHEQARPDQKHFINIHYQNIPISRWNNFHPLADSHASTYDLPYDAGSVMHYGPFGFAIDPYRPTISTINSNLQSTIGQRIEPSFLDIQSINVAYDCYAHCPPLECAHGGYPNPNDCTRCNCPSGFGGKLCRQVEHTNCGGVVEVSRHLIFINSPNYPKAFPMNKTCIWHLKAKPAKTKPAAVNTQRRIIFEFVENFHYQCEDSTTCDKSFVELKTGPDFRTTGFRFCCSLVPMQKFVSAGEEMIVIHVGGDEPTLGFKARVWLVGDVDEGSSVEEGMSTSSPTQAPIRVFPSTSLAKNWTDTVVMSTKTEPKTTETWSQTTTYVKTTTETATAVASTLLPLPGEVFKSTTIFSFTELPESTTMDTTPKPILTFPPWPFFTLMPPITPLLPIGLLTTPNPSITTTSMITTDVEGYSTTQVALIRCAEECTPWSEWTPCNQQCGGCGRRTRVRLCAKAEIRNECPAEEKRACNFGACPGGTNFLFNNAEFHILWKGCCVGMFRKMNGGVSGDQCAPLQSGENAFIRIISSLLSAQEKSKNKTMLHSESEPGDGAEPVSETIKNSNYSNNRDNIILMRRLANLANAWKVKDSKNS